MVGAPADSCDLDKAKHAGPDEERKFEGHMILTVPYAELCHAMWGE